MKFAYTFSHPSIFLSFHYPTSIYVFAHLSIHIPFHLPSNSIIRFSPIYPVAIPSPPTHSTTLSLPAHPLTTLPPTQSPSHHPPIGKGFLFISTARELDCISEIQFLFYILHFYFPLIIFSLLILFNHCLCKHCKRGVV